MKTHTRFITHHVSRCLRRVLASGSRSAAITLMAALWLLGSVSVALAAPAFSTSGPLVQGRSNHTTTLLPNGKLLVVGGYNGSALATAELYNPATGTWTATGSLATARYGHSATLLANGKVLIAGGQVASYLASAELYDPVTGTWQAAGNLTTARGRHTATLLPNGKVLVAGGGGERRCHAHEC